MEEIAFLQNVVVCKAERISPSIERCLLLFSAPSIPIYISSLVLGYYTRIGSKRREALLEMRHRCCHKGESIGPNPTYFQAFNKRTRRYAYFCCSCSVTWLILHAIGADVQTRIIPHFCWRGSPPFLSIDPKVP